MMALGFSNDISWAGFGFPMTTHIRGLRFSYDTPHEGLGGHCMKGFLLTHITCKVDTWYEGGCEAKDIAWG